MGSIRIIKICILIVIAILINVEDLNANGKYDLYI